MPAASASPYAPFRFATDLTLPWTRDAGLSLLRLVLSPLVNREPQFINCSFILHCCCRSLRVRCLQDRLRLSMYVWCDPVLVRSCGYWFGYRIPGTGIPLWFCLG